MAILQALQVGKRFTPAETALAEFLLAHPEEIASMNISDLAGRAYTSHPTIIRLCRKIGLSGYKELRLALAAEMEKQRFAASDVDFNDPFEEKESQVDIMKKIQEISCQALDSCYAAVSPLAVQQMARAILRADTLYLFAAGDTAISAIGFANMLMKLGIHAVLANQYGETMSMACNATGRDLALVVSYSGSQIQALKKELRVLRRSGCPIACITAGDRTEEMDLVLTFPFRERQYGKAAGFYSQTAIRYLLNCLYGVIYAQNPAHNQARKYRAETMTRREGREP